MKSNKVIIDSNIKALAWDFDGTIINSFVIVKELATTIAKTEGVPVPNDEMFLQNFHATMRETIKALLVLDGSESETDRLLGIFLENQISYYESLDEHLIDDALALLDRAKKAGLIQVLVTNRAHTGHGIASPHAIVKNSILKEAITTVLAGDEVEFRKPDARVLDSFLKKHHLKPHEVLVVGDQFVDALLAMNLGTKAILVHRYGDEIVNLDRLGDGWQDHVTIVNSLHDVEFS